MTREVPARLQVLADDEPVGWLEADLDGRMRFGYEASWLTHPQRFALSLTPPDAQILVRRCHGRGGRRDART